jgi:Meiotically up-regulated gene 113
MRIVTQGAKTAHPEVPIIALIFETDDSHNLERLIHASLAYAGRHQKGSPGAEWFLTNPTEVENLYASLEGMRKPLRLIE